MRRRSRAGGEPVKARRRKTVTLKRRTVPKAVRSSSDATHETEIARVIRERDEALEQQTAISDILRVISNSPSDVQPVLDSVAEHAARICEAHVVDIAIVDNEAFRIAASFGEFGRHSSEESLPLDRSTVTGRSICDLEPVHVADVQNASAEFPLGREMAIKFGHRTILSVPLMREGRALGAILVRRTEVRPFEQKHISLLTTFADQAAIAIENVRLFEAEQQRTRELTESLQQQTATADVLKVISSSRGELEPVFKALLENGARLCGASYAGMWLREADAFRCVAVHGVLSGYWETGALFRPEPDAPISRAAKTKQPFQIANIRASQFYRDGNPLAVSAVKAGLQAVLAVPMLKENDFVGAIVIYSKEARPFTDKQIELLENFGSQAVIAIENARLLNELRERTDDLTGRTADLTEALEQQTATSEVLQVISSSPGDLQPVFETMLQKAVSICDAKFGNIYRWDGEFLHLLAAHNTPPALAEVRKHSPLRPSSLIQRVLEAKTAAHVVDLAVDPDYVERRAPGAVAAVELGGVRTFLSVPMLQENELIGSFSLYREEVRPFTDKQIELVTNFAAQAVIAIENARLLNETKEALERQTATADILKVIASSPTDVQPVFEAIVNSAASLFEPCAATITILKDDKLHWSATAALLPGFDVQHARAIYPIPFDPQRSPSARAVLERRVIEIPDIEDPDTPEFTRNAAAAGGFRSITFVPLVDQGQGIGTIIFTHPRAGFKFSDRQLALVQTFADQAVIAIQNTRLFNEVQQRTHDLSESLQQQTATSDVLKVISRSTFDLPKVLNTLLKSAARLCEADKGQILRPTRKDGSYNYAASYRHTPEYEEHVKTRPFAPGRSSVTGRVLLEGKSIQIADVLADPEWTYLEAAELGGFRTILGVPLLREGIPIGVFALQRAAVRPFTDKQIELVETFADQAVIAIENTRLFEAEQQRTRELSESLEQQTATSEVLQVISALRAIFSRYLRPCSRKPSASATPSLEISFVGMATPFTSSRRTICRLPSPSYAGVHRFVPVRKTLSVAWWRPKRWFTSPIWQRSSVYIEDAIQQSLQPSNLAACGRSVAVPMLKENELIGALIIYRQEVRPFTDKQIELVTNFRRPGRHRYREHAAAQRIARIAEQQTATAECSRSSAARRSICSAVFEAVLENAVTAVRGRSAFIYRFDGELLRMVRPAYASPAISGVESSTIRFDPAGQSVGPCRARTRTIHIADVAADPEYSYGSECIRARPHGARCPILEKAMTVGVL